jgi:D-3-phosphoglycerate dehydrogenase
VNGRRPRVVATARAFCAADGPHQALIRDAGLELVLAAGAAPLDGAALAALAADADALLLGLDRCDAAVFAAAPRLRVVSRFGAGVDTVDLAAAVRHGVTVTNTPGANTTAVAELTLGLLLALARDLPAAIATARGGGWGRRAGWELDGKTLGLVGLGRIGRAVASRAAAFGMRVIAHDPYAPDVPGVERVTLDELWPAADAVSLHLGLEDASRHLVDAAALARMKPTAVLLNTSRGGLVDEEALADALRAGTIAGAAADAFDREPPTGSPLLELPNFLPTPHLGAATREAARRMGEGAARNVVAVLTGVGAADVVVAPDLRRPA